MRALARFAVLVTATAGITVVGTATWAQDTMLDDCSEASFRSAVSAGGTVTWSTECTVHLTGPVEIPTGLAVTIDGGATSTAFLPRVTLDAQQLGRHFDVTGGTLILRGIALYNGRVVGARGGDGAFPGTAENGDSGMTGSTPTSVVCTGGPAAQPGGPGGDGTPANAGRDASGGLPGGEARGASILISAGDVTLTTVSINAATAVGGAGGRGGDGGTGGIGGAGGAGGSGQQGFKSVTGQRCTDGGSGGKGGDGGAGGDGGRAGRGGAGGAVNGGVIFNAGNLTLVNTIFQHVTITPGRGGDGGTGGSAGLGGAGGHGGSGGNGAATDGGKGGTAGRGGDTGGLGGTAGRGGDGGLGGAVVGGLIASEGTLHISGLILPGGRSTLTAGTGGTGGPGGAGGAGGAGGDGGGGGGGGVDEKGGTYPGGDSAAAGAGGDGGAGGAAGFGGQGGGAQGGAVSSTGPFAAANTDIGMLIVAGRGGAGGIGGMAGSGGLGGRGQRGGPPGPATKDGVPASSGGSGGAGGRGGDAGTSGASGDGGTGGTAIGGAIATTAALSISGSSTDLGGRATGGDGGTGGLGSRGAQGGDGNYGGSGGNGGAGASTGVADTAGGDGGSGGAGAPGSAAGNGGAAGKAGAGGDAGNALGGSIAILTGGSLTMTDGQVAASAYGGSGGFGGDGVIGGGGGFGGYGGDGGSGGPAGNGPAGQGNGANAGNGSGAGPGGSGGLGGAGGDTGRGGTARGGAIYAADTLNLTRVTLARSTAQGGSTGRGGRGALGGTGGPGGFGGGSGSFGVGQANGRSGSSADGAAGGAGGPGGKGGSAGPAGDGYGGGVYTEATTWRVQTLSYSNDRALGGAGSAGGAGGGGGQGGAGGWGAGGGNASSPGPGLAGGAGGRGGNGGAAASGGAAGKGGSGRGGGVFATVAPALYTGFSYDADVVSAGAAGPSCSAGNNGCGGDPGPGGAGGRGGSPGDGILQPDAPPGTPVPMGPVGPDGAAGTSTGAGADGGGATAGVALYADCSPRVCSTDNQPPDGVGDVYDTVPDELLTVNAPGVLANDTDTDGQSISALLVEEGHHGTVDLTETGAFTYLPAANFRGIDTFVYRASDGIDESPDTTVTVRVDRRPVADGDPQPRSKAGAAVVVAAPGVLANDADGDSDTLTAVKASNPAHGTVTLSTDGAFTYVPTAGFRGNDSFTYQADDGLLRSTPATVFLQVNGKPVAVADSYATRPGATLSVGESKGVLVNDTDPDTDGLTAAVVGGPSHGTLTLGVRGSIEYRPAAGFTGEDTFTYRVDDGLDTSAPTTVTITVGSLPAPTATVGGRSVQKNNGAVKVTITCGASQACRLEATGTLLAAGRKYNLATSRANIGAKERRTLVLKVPPRARSAAATALKHGKKVNAFVKIFVSNTAGTSRTLPFKVALTLP